MSNTALSIVAALAMGIVVVGCNSSSGYKPVESRKVASATMSPGEERLLYPVTVGDKWVYRLTQETATAQRTGSGEAEYELTVMDAKTTGKETRATIDQLVRGKSLGTIGYVINDKGVSQLWAPVRAQGTQNYSRGDCNPPQLMIPFPCKEGAKFKYSSHGPTPENTIDDVTTEGKVDGIQEIDTDMGRMSAVAVSARTTWPARDKNGAQLKDNKGKPAMCVSVATTWYAPKIGLVRQVTENHTPGMVLKAVLVLKGDSLKE